MTAVVVAPGWWLWPTPTACLGAEERIDDLRDERWCADQVRLGRAVVVDDSTAKASAA